MNFLQKITKNLLTGVLVSGMMVLNTQAGTNKIDANEILLPAQRVSNTTLFRTAIQSELSQKQKFTNKYGNWSFSIDAVLNTPRFAMGKPAQIDGYNSINEDNAANAALKFLEENKSLFNIKTSDLILQRIDFVNNKWYITFKQQINGADILFSKTDLRISPEGKVIYFDIEYYNNININTTPTISVSQALTQSTEGMKTKAHADSPLSSVKKYILPIKDKGNVTYKLVYKINTSDDVSGKYVNYIDAHAGSIVWRYNTVKKLTEFTATGTVRAKSPLDDITTEAMPNLAVKIGSETVYSDENGKVSIPDVTVNTPVSANLEGKWAKVYTEGRARGKFLDTLRPGQEFSMMWNDNNSHRYERNMYYYTNHIHNYIKELDPAMTCIDRPLSVIVGYAPDAVFGNEINAFSDGDTIKFLNTQNPSAVFADAASILYHEYGHSLNTLFYIDHGVEEGMINGACHEALADITAAIILDDHEVGKGAFVDEPETLIRDLKNINIYPDSINGESHHDSQILSGAFWDLREMTTNEVVKKLHHFARYSLPDDIDNGTAFYEWLVAVINADDDNNDLSDGTPHINDIIAAFNNHRIGSNLAYNNSFEHTPLEDTQNTSEPYLVEFKFGSVSQLFGAPDSIEVKYLLNNNSTEYVVNAVLQSNGKYAAFIPAQEKGTIINYYISYYDQYSKERFAIKPYYEYYNFLVGYKTALLDQFETDTKWKFGSDIDNASRGQFERANPYFFGDENFGTFKPEDDYSVDGEMCMITGKGSETEPADYMEMFSYFTNGTTTITSPIYDLSVLEMPLIKYMQYYYKLEASFTGVPAGFPTNTVVDITNDGGLHWINVNSDTSTGSQGWVEKYFRFEDFLEKTDNCQIRFSYISPEGSFFPAAFGSWAIDDFEIKTTNDQVITSVDDISDLSNQVNTYPNPFTGFINFDIGNRAESQSTLSIFNMLGEKVFASDIYLNAGHNNFVWQGIRSDGSTLPAGVYMYQLNNCKNTVSGKISKK